MRKMVLAGCMALGLALGTAELSSARADHGRGGYGAPSCHHGHSRGGYGVGYAPYGSFYAAPVYGVPTFVPVGGYSAFGQSRHYGGYGNIYGSGFGGGYGNLGYPSPYRAQNLPRVQLRIGF